MDKIKRFFDCYIPVTTCTLRCHYCYIAMHRLFEAEPIEMPYSADFIRKAMSKERLGGTCLINFCAGGETLIAHQVLDYTKSLIEEGHYVSIVTNATLSKRFDEIAKWPKNITSHILFKFSYHYLQLKEKNLLDTFFKNIKKVRDAGCSINVEITPNDELIPFVDECIDLCVRELGAKPHITIGRDERDPKKLPILTDMSRDDYYKFWGDKFQSEFFDFKKSIFEVPRKEFCYAGGWTGYINMGNGNMTQCYKSNYSQNIFENIDKPIVFCPIGKCKEHHCYNGHVWLSIGDIPNLPVRIPTYAELRNRVCKDGSEWLQPELKAFLGTHVFESNKQLNQMQKSICLLNCKFTGLPIVGRVFRRFTPFIRCKK